MSLIDPAAANRQKAAAHCRRRAWERLGLVMTDRELEELAAACRQRTPLGRTICTGRPVYRLEWRCCLVWVIYDERLQSVVTLLAGPPKSGVRPWRRRRAGR